jgi:hypothetical protein
MVKRHHVLMTSHMPPSAISRLCTRSVGDCLGQQGITGELPHDACQLLAAASNAVSFTSLAIGT